MKRESFWRAGIWPALLFVLSLSGCDFLQEQAEDYIQPDVVVVALSGRCSIFDTSCTPPFGNHTYLEQYDRRARQAVVGAFEGLGLKVEYFDASAFIAEHYSAVSGSMEPGYAEAEAYLQRIYEQWIQGREDHTRIVLLAHSHGTVWGSLLPGNHPDWTFDYFIYLDGICSYWEGDHLENNTLVQDYYNSIGEPLPWPIAQTGGVCDLSWPNLSSAEDVEDVSLWNVVYSLEIRSSSVPQDNDINVRPDGRNGSEVGMATIQTSDTHGSVTKEGSEALTWVIGMIEKNGLPSAQAAEDVMPQRAPSLELVPAPPGYEYAN